MPVFDVLIIEHPTKKDKEDGKLETILLGPETLVAKDATAVVMQLAIVGKFPKVEDVNRVEVIVRPFA